MESNDRRPSARGRIAGAVLAVAMLALVSATAATAYDNRSDWDCGGRPYDACYSPSGSHTWSRTTAINTSSAYRKCAKLEGAGSGFVYVRNCYESTEVIAYSDQGGLGYPNTSTLLNAAVGNDTPYYRGLRGVGYF